MDDSRVLIVGASARAAAFSALRAGLRPWCADLFADADLQPLAPVTRISPDRYPEAFLGLVSGSRPGPWFYTGGLENRPALVERMAERRPLWGNDAPVLRRIRSPFQVAAVLRQHELTCPAVWAHPDEIPSACAALVKPLRGSGGTGIQFVSSLGRRPATRGVYFQQYVKGEPCAAIYLAVCNRCQLLGVTRQLVGEDWLHARPFHYCGNIGPLMLDNALSGSFQRLGSALASGFGLRGLFGVDCVLGEGVPWPVEVNPRYTASVEVLEQALGIRALLLHQQAFEGDRLETMNLNRPEKQSYFAFAGGKRSALPCVGKAILFAREPLVFPADGPWQPTLTRLVARDADGPEFPAFADIPQAGEPIPARRPALTFFATGTSPDDCSETLQAIARDLDRWLFKR